MFTIQYKHLWLRPVSSNYQIWNELPSTEQDVRGCKLSIKIALNSFFTNEAKMKIVFKYPLTIRILDFITITSRHKVKETTFH